ncbi:MAG: TetR/AcrR family transcriptional regulator [Balneolaceae bacterium]|nr:TetR/AcrR family transcriptional regulator [Balneolaceae bacterium]
MGTEERKMREKERRRDQILDAAERVIFSQGLDQSTMEEIAEEAELSKGTLYLYFRNKKELYLGICERGSNLLNGRLAKVFAAERSGLEMVRELGEVYLRFVRENPHYFTAFMHYESSMNLEELQESEMVATCEKNVREAMTFIIRALQIGMQDGTIDDAVEPRELAVIIWGSTKGLVQISHMKEQGHHFKMMDEMDLNVDSIYENYLNLIGRAIAAGTGR